MSPSAGQNAVETRLEEQEELGIVPAGFPDQRDQRDPQAMGEYVLSLRHKHNSAPGCPVVDIIEMERSHIGGDPFQFIPNYDPSPVNYAADRERELRERAAHGDRFAAAVLAGDSLAEDPVE